jgi:hypothetical protein
MTNYYKSDIVNTEFNNNDRNLQCDSVVTK